MNLTSWLSVAKQPPTPMYCDTKLNGGKTCDFPLRYTGKDFADPGAFVCDACVAAEAQRRDARQIEMFGQAAG